MLTRNWLSLYLCIVVHFGLIQSHRKYNARYSLRRVLTRVEHVRHKHKRQEAITDKTTEIVAEHVSVNYERKHIIVYVDQNNVPTSTETRWENQIAPTAVNGDQGSAPNAQAQGQSPKAAEVPVAPPSVQQNLQPPATSNKKEDSKEDGDKKPKKANGGSGFGSGVTYSPYNSDHSCKSADQVANDLKDISEFEVIRLYGTDCDQVAKVIRATKGGVGIFAGIFQIDKVQDEVETLASAVNGKWDVIHAVSVGNELVNSKAASADKVSSAIASARSALKAKGYSGPVVTVDTMMAYQDHPELCEASDFCAINCHAFFDGNVTPDGAGQFVAQWAEKISRKAGGKRTVVTESGWPTKGSSNKNAVPGKAEHQQAIQSLKQSFKQDLILYTLFDDLWKSDRGDTHGAEKYWGLRGSVN